MPIVLQISPLQATQNRSLHILLSWTAGHSVTLNQTPILKNRPFGGPDENIGNHLIRRDRFPIPRL